MGNGASQGVVVGDAPRQALPPEALPPERAQFDLGHVQPRAVLGRVVQLDALGQALGLGGRERLVKAGQRVGVQLVHDQHHAFGVAIALQQAAHEMGPSDQQPLPHIIAWPLM